MTSEPTHDPADMLSQPPSEDDLEELLAEAAPRRRSKLTVALVAALVFLLGFFLGSTVERVAQSMADGQTEVPEGDGQPPDPSEPLLVGTITVVEDGTLYLERAGGGTVKVHTDETTLVGVSRPGEVEDLAPGDVVIVRGETTGDGSVAATSVQERIRGR